MFYFQEPSEGGGMNNPSQTYTDFHRYNGKLGCVYTAIHHPAWGDDTSVVLRTFVAK